MSTHEANPGNEVNPGFNAMSGLPGELGRDLFGQPLIKAPTALSRHDYPLLNHENSHSDAGENQIDQLTGLQKDSTLTNIYGDEFESGIPPIDQAAHLVGKTLDAAEKVIESGIPVVNQTAHDAVAQISEMVHNSIDAAQKRWDAPDNQFRDRMNQGINQTIEFVKQKITDLSADPDIREAIDATTDLGHTLTGKTENVIHATQSAAEAWVDKAFGSSYFDRSLTANQSDRSNPSFVGVIDTGFKVQDHGAQVLDILRQSGYTSKVWLGDTVGTGRWAESLVQFVDAAKSSGRLGAIVNLSFDLSQINPDGSVTTRFELTSAEREALRYAQKNNVLIVAASGNQGGAMSALGQAAQEFDNIIVVGATEHGQRADYSSYGQGLTLVASGNGGGVEGTSLSAAEVTAAASKVWQSNSQLGYHQVIQTLELTAIDLEQPGWDSETGFGQLNISAAVDLAEDTVNKPQLFSDSQFFQNKKPENQNQLTVSFNEFVDQAIPSERPAFSWNGVKKWFSDTAHSAAKATVDFFHNTAEFVEDVKGGVSYLGKQFTDTGGGNDPPASSVNREKPQGTDSTDELTSPHLFRYEPGQTLVSSEAVKQWQQRMKDLNYDIEVDGFYGQQSKQVAEQFQEANGLAKDGVVGPATWEKSFSNDVKAQPTPTSLEPCSTDNVFEVQPGETLWSIAEEKLGNGDLWYTNITHAKEHRSFTEEEANNLKPGTPYYIFPDDSIRSDDLATGFLEGAGHQIKDIATGIANNAKFSWNLVTNPKETIQGVAETVRNIKENPKEAAAQAAGEALNVDVYKEYIENDQYIQATGHALFDLVASGGGGKLFKIPRALSKLDHFNGRDTHTPDPIEAPDPRIDGQGGKTPPAESSPSINNDAPVPPPINPSQNPSPSIDTNEASPSPIEEPPLSNDAPDSTQSPEANATTSDNSHSAEPSFSSTSGTSHTQLEQTSGDNHPLGARGGANPRDEPDHEGTHRGIASNRSFNPDRAGGPLLDLSTDRLKITPRGIERVEQHLSRFGYDAQNAKQIERLKEHVRELEEFRELERRYHAGEIDSLPEKPKPDSEDLNFYAHELRESVRYRKEGYEDRLTGRVWQPTDRDREVWNDAHTATLEEYGHTDDELYHPSTEVDSNADRPFGGKGPIERHDDELPSSDSEPNDPNINRPPGQSSDSDELTPAEIAEFRETSGRDLPSERLQDPEARRAVREYLERIRDPRQVAEDIIGAGSKVFDSDIPPHINETDRLPSERPVPQNFDIGNFAHEFAELFIDESELPRGLNERGRTKEVIIKLPDGGTRRPDRVDWEEGVVYEIKSKHELEKGRREAKRDAHHMDEQHPLPGGRKWKSKVVTYDRDEVIKFAKSIGWIE